MLKETRSGWIGSVVLHLALLLLLVAVSVTPPTQVPEFLEVTWGTATPEVRQLVPEPSSRPASAGPRERTVERPTASKKPAQP
ncbi:MAG: hypothetical protein WD295_05250, partial [Bacteroidota bacterium]